MDIENIKDYKELFDIVTGSDVDAGVKARARLKELSKNGEKEAIIEFLKSFLTTDKSFEAYGVIADITGLQFIEAVMKYPAKKKS